MNKTRKENVSVVNLFLPVLFLLFLIIYGLILLPRVYHKPAFPLEIIFLLATIFSSSQLLILKFKWKTIQKAIIAKLAKGFPAILILFAIGLIIGSWMVSGTIPMLIYYGIKLINPDYIYILAFCIPAIFSILTGTSWGSVATIGTILIGVGATVNADLGITAGAIIGGAYFGDKMSPLSDTTNIAALSAGVNLYGHIKSMMFTTIPSAIVATVLFFVLGFIFPTIEDENSVSQVSEIMISIKSMFNLNLFLLIPPLIVLYGSLKRMATLPTLLASAMVSCLLALIFQDFDVETIIITLKQGFNTEMASWALNVPNELQILFNRGGLYELNEIIIFSLMALSFIGTLDVTDTMPKLINIVFSFTKNRTQVILSSMVSTAFTNAMTSNQIATSFIVGDAFKNQYDKFHISRKVLSRSIEDYGTMIESIIPWHATTLFMVTTLGVPFEDYWHWQLLSLANLVIAPTLAIFGIGCFYNKSNSKIN
tara:strand:+ start:17243 stop:18688 length:1446 start_codon:yes stop_codon:yes gene_type:complete